MSDSQSVNVSQQTDHWNEDVLGREKIAKFLENIILQSGGNFILNINSPWGTGKTFLIERMIEDLKKTNLCIYFNAWEEDFSDSAFLAFVSVIQREFQNSLGANGMKKQINSFLEKTGKFLIRLTPIMVKAGFRFALDNQTVEEFTKLTSPDTKSDFTDEIGNWAKEQIDSQLGKKEARDEFKNTLSETLNLLSGDGLRMPLIIFVDDLDRCRPTFAIELLESIKHIFNIQNVAFVIATDSIQLSESIKAVYGSGVDSNTYLKKILDNQFNLPLLNYDKFSTLIFHKFNIEQKEIFLYDGKDPKLIFARFAESFNLSLRDQEQVFRKIELIIKASRVKMHFAFLVFLMIVAYKFNKIYNKYKSEQIVLEGILNSIRNDIVISKLPTYFSEVLKTYDICILQNDQVNINRNHLIGLNHRTELDTVKFNIFDSAFKEKINKIVYLNFVDMADHFE
ncbi:P-loop NTPase fold protein [Leptospira santarosai]|uniref:KAP family P-loop NTPase fold protein n=1 Tax=Leptospira santarosai TaxID=28183 RepID=UPI0002C02FCB|nr:P-loop NTPase fold protein [Leptospira santarosai]EMO70748.1 hypothetical protein LEP1GSC130_0114 [Leptospira santarosai str. 200403458]EMO99505.1 hypothetical protein LEP1GSC120_2619 [Leptospira santarosai str. 200702252]